MTSKNVKLGCLLFSQKSEEAFCQMQHTQTKPLHTTLLLPHFHTGTLLIVSCSCNLPAVWRRRLFATDQFVPKRYLNTVSNSPKLLGGPISIFSISISGDRPHRTPYQIRA
jgi:hypothetical protein